MNEARNNQNDQPIPRISGMYGIYRWVMSYIAVLAHLGPYNWVSGGFYCVFGFFTLSGYLMSKAIVEIYGVERRGVGRYLLNRFLRIFPPFWVALLFAVAVAKAYPLAAQAVHPYFTLPGSPGGWLGNIGIAGMVSLFGVRPDHLIIPPAWSLVVEWVYYLLLPLLLWNRNIRLFFVTLAFGYPFFAPGVTETLYFSPLAGGLPFLLGMLMYLAHRRRAWPAPRAAIIPAVAVLVFFAVPSSAAFAVPLQGRLYIGLICNAVIIHTLSYIDRRKVSPRLRRIDTLLGDLSYPVFLVHVAAGVLVAAWGGFGPRSFALYFASLLPVQAVAFALYLIIEIPVNRLRDRVRAS